MNTLVRCGREEKYHYLHNNGDSFQENVHSFNLIYIDCSFLYFLFTYNLKVHVVYILDVCANLNASIGTQPTVTFTTSIYTSTN